MNVDILCETLGLMEVCFVCTELNTDLMTKIAEFSFYFQIAKHIQEIIAKSTAITIAILLFAKFCYC